MNIITRPGNDFWDFGEWSLYRGWRRNTGVFECGHIINTHLHIYHVILHLKSWIRFSIFRNNHTFAQLGCSSPFTFFRFTGTNAHLKLNQLGICSLQITHPVEIMIFSAHLVCYLWTLGFLCSLQINPSTFFSTFAMAQLGKISRHHWNGHLKISKLAKFETERLKREKI